MNKRCFEEHCHLGTKSVVRVNNQLSKFNFFILGFLYFWLGYCSKSTLAVPKSPSHQPKAPTAIAKQPDRDRFDESNPVTWSTSAAELVPEDQVAAEKFSQVQQEPPFQPVPPTNQPPSNTAPTQEQTTFKILRGYSLQNRQPILTTAHQLLGGEFLIPLRYRQSFPANNRSGNLTGQPTLGFSWGITNNLELTFDAQSIYNGGPGRQGSFNAQRTTSTGSGNIFQELTLQAKQRLWQNAEGTQALSGVVAISRGVRSYRFSATPGDPLSHGTNKEELVPSLELPYTIATGDRLQFTLSPKIAFLPEDNALYFRRLPVANPGSFGTTFGLAGGVIYHLNPRVSLWGDAFIPFTGNNTISRSTGLPDRTFVYNAGLRYLVNPRLSTDVFVSNALGNTGALSVIGDKDYPSLGLAVTFIPGITSENRRYPSHFGATQQPPHPELGGFAFLDGGTIPSGQLLTTVQGGGQGLLASLQYGLLDDLQIGATLDNVSGTTDESLLGLSGKIRFLHQADGAPFTLSGAFTIGRSNNVLINYIHNNANEFKQRGFTKSGFAFSNENQGANGQILDNGQLYIITLSAPAYYQFKNGNSVWLTPTLGFIQTNGLQLAGFNFGGSTPLTTNLNLIAEAGLDLSGKGNGFIGSKRETTIPWSVGLRWNPSFQGAISGLQLETYLTNRVGSSPFESLRVEAGNPVTVGVGARLPIQF